MGGMTEASEVRGKNPAEKDEPDSDQAHPKNRVDHRPNNGPLLELLWSEEEPLMGQTLYLGAEFGVDGKIYCLPGHAPRVLVIDPETDKIYPVGPTLTSNGTKFKWLRGITVGDVIYGLPCHASEILRIHVPTLTVTKLPIPYEKFFSDPVEAKDEREMVWKYHGGNISPIDNCIYAIPQSAGHVLKIDMTTDTCSLVGPKLEGKYKWYGGVIGKVDGAIYGIPHNSPSVLRITPSSITLHGDYGPGGHKWHGASRASNGLIVCVPANADTVLCITPADPEPILEEIGDKESIQTGRHRSDGKYKYLGGMTGTDGKVYIFPSGSEYVLQVDANTMIVKNVGPNLKDTGMERVKQNKWQNGLMCVQDKCVYAIPLAGETILRIDCSKEDEDPEITTWKLPAPYKVRDKWEGGVITPTGVMYTVPNNCKAVLRIEPCKLNLTKNGEPPSTTTSTEPKESPADKREAKTEKKIKKHKQMVVSQREYGGDNENLVYKSGIPTLRSSAHRVKFAPKNRKHDPKPRDQDGNETKTTWLPPELIAEDICKYDVEKYDIKGAVVSMLKRCDPEIVGQFTEPGDDASTTRLEDFCVPVPSVWRSVNGGRCEDAQKYLSDTVASDSAFLELFDRFVAEVALPSTKQRLIAAGAAEKDKPLTFYYQRPPTMRLQPGPSWAKVKAHNDAEYGHQNGELNFWLPLTDRTQTGVDLFSETSFKEGDYHPMPAAVGEVISFHGSSCRHYVNTNSTACTRVSLDFRVGVQGFFDPYWQMQGTTDDHGRKEVTL